jgi:hypothetical protein
MNDFKKDFSGIIASSDEFLANIVRAKTELMNQSLYIFRNSSDDTIRQIEFKKINVYINEIQETLNQLNNQLNR